jgi:hypothetical protein
MAKKNERYQPWCRGDLTAQAKTLRQRNSPQGFDLRSHKSVNPI